MALTTVTFVRPDGDRGPLEILQSVAHTFTVDVYENDLPVSVSSATVRVQKPSGEDLVAEASVTPAAGADGSTTNRLAYTLSAGNAATLDERYIITWTATISSGKHAHRVLFDICKTELINTVREEDLFDRAPKLRDHRMLEIVDGTADSGTTTTLVDAQLQAYPDDTYNGGILEIQDGTNEGEWREVSDFVRSTGTVTVGVAFASAVDATSVYRLRRSWAPLIAEAFEEIRWRLRSEGWRPGLVVDSYELHNPTVLLAIALAFETAPGGGPDGENWQTAQEYRRQFTEWWGRSQFHYDSGEDGIPDVITEKMAVVHARRY